MTDQPQSELPPTRAEAAEYKESLGVVRSREEAEAIAEQEAKG